MHLRTRTHTAWLQANSHDMARKLQHKQAAGGLVGGSVAVSASALGSKDSLYTIQDAPAVPQHRIPAAPAQVGRAGGQRLFTSTRPATLVLAGHGQPARLEDTALPPYAPLDRSRKAG